MKNEDITIVTLSIRTQDIKMLKKIAAELTLEHGDEIRYLDLIRDSIIASIKKYYGEYK
jgi:hypothetical protein